MIASLEVPHRQFVFTIPKRDLHFLDMAYGSAREVEYQVGLAHRLGFLSDQAYGEVGARSTETAKVLNGLLRSFRR